MANKVKQKILNAANEKFQHFGYKKATVDEIAEEANISKRTIYEVFSSKEEILSELFMSEAFRVRSTVTKKIKEKQDPVEKLTVFIKYANGYFVENPFLRKVFNDESGLFSPFLKNEIETVENGIVEIIKRIYAEGKEKGVFRPLDFDTASRCIYVLFRYYTRESHAGTNGTWMDFVLNAILEPGINK